MTKKGSINWATVKTITAQGLATIAKNNWLTSYKGMKWLVLLVLHEKETTAVQWQYHHCLLLPGTRAGEVGEELAPTLR